LAVRSAGVSGDGDKEGGEYKTHISARLEVEAESAAAAERLAESIVANRNFFTRLVDSLVVDGDGECHLELDEVGPEVDDVSEVEDAEPVPGPMRPRRKV
jgi:hypothetical protein